MGKHCETFEHTADVGLAARADTLGGLFEALAEGLADYICSRQSVRADRTRPVAVRAEDVEALAVDFLWEVMTAIQAGRFMVATARVKEISDTAVAAELAGEAYDPARHELKTEVKAVTYHQLKIAREGEQWIGRVILDL